MVSVDMTNEKELRSKRSRVAPVASPTSSGCVLVLERDLAAAQLAAAAVTLIDDSRVDVLNEGVQLPTAPPVIEELGPSGIGLLPPSHALSGFGLSGSVVRQVLLRVLCPPSDGSCSRVARMGLLPGFVIELDSPAITSFSIALLRPAHRHGSGETLEA